MSTEEITAAIRSYILETCPPAKRDLGFTDGSSLVATGILDSVGVFSLVGFLEQRYGIDVPDDELDWKTFESVDGIARLVRSKLAGAELT